MRKSFLTAAVLIAIALGTMLILAFQQFRLYGRHETIISQTEKVLFQYSNIREQILEDIVEGKLDELPQLTPAVEELHANLVGILDNRLIPAEYKVSFLQQVDLPGLIMLLRKASAEQQSLGLLRRVNEESRVIGEQFMLFERLVLGYAKQKLVDFQSVIIGILALLVFLVTLLLVITYRFLIAPVVNLSLQSRNLLSGDQECIYPVSGWAEVENLGKDMNQLADDVAWHRLSLQRYERLCVCLHEVTKKISGANNQEVLFQVLCRQLLTNSDYVLAWVGVEDQDSPEITPLVVDGSASMSCDECQECFPALLAAQEEANPAYRAHQHQKPVVMADVLSKAPKGPFKNTPLADDRIDSVSLPLKFQRRQYGVLTIYMKVTDTISDAEIQLLDKLAVLVGLKAYSLESEAALDCCRYEKMAVGEHVEVLSFSLDHDGQICSVETNNQKSPYANMFVDWKGKPVSDTVCPENESEHLVFRESLKNRQHYNFKARLCGVEDIFSATLEPMQKFPAGQGSLLLVLVAPHKHLLFLPENFRIAYAAAIGLFAGCIAHEITDLSNGIINYAQMLRDEVDSIAEPEAAGNCNRIISNGEKVAAMVEPLMLDQDDLEFSRNMESIDKIFHDVLLLIEPRFKQNNLKIDLAIEPSSLHFKNQHVQLILFDLLTRLGDLLQHAGCGVDGQRGIKVAVTPVSRDERKMVQVSFHCSAELGEFDEDAYLGSTTGLWLSRELARALGGEVRVGGADQSMGEVQLILPA